MGLFIPPHKGPYSRSIWKPWCRSSPPASHPRPQRNPLCSRLPSIHTLSLP